MVAIPLAKPVREILVSQGRENGGTSYSEIFMAGLDEVRGRPAAGPGMRAFSENRML